MIGSSEAMSRYSGSTAIHRPDSNGSLSRRSELAGRLAGG